MYMDAVDIYPYIFWIFYIYNEYNNEHIINWLQFL